MSHGAVFGMVQGIDLHLIILMERQNILNFMGNTSKLMLIHSQMPKIESIPAQKLNLLLTPQFYTLKREEIPVKYAYQAKRIAPSLFDGLLEDAHSYKYFVEKEKDIWLCIAYDEEKIRTFLQSKGIALDKVSKVFFVEQVADKFTSPVLLGESEALVNFEGSMTLVPQSVLTDEETPMRIDKSFTPKEGIKLENRGDALISTNESYIIASIFSIFALLYFIEGSRYDGNSAVEEEMQSLLTNHTSLESGYTRKSILDKYRVIDVKERKKREIIKSLSHMIFKGSTLTSLTLNDKGFSAAFSCTAPSVSLKVQDLAKEKKFNTSKIAKSNDLKIEGTL